MLIGKISAPIIDLGGADELVGSLREDRTIVSIVPELSVIPETGPVCRYEISSDLPSQDIPFVAEVTDEQRGRGEIRVKEGMHLDCSSPHYRFNLVAVRCDDQVRSESIPLRISIRDTNDHAPEFAQPWYTFDIDEGNLLLFPLNFEIYSDMRHFIKCEPISLNH
uniref:Cadherin domain-containing protein n=1 Tax=Parascaris equorum TaxID=6256 RepID=A0A914RIW5_PAREQ